MATLLGLQDPCSWIATNSLDANGSCHTLARNVWLELPPKATRSPMEAPERDDFISHDLEALLILGASSSVDHVIKACFADVQTSYGMCGL